MTPITIALVLVVLIIGVFLYRHIQEYERTNSFWTSVEQGIKEHTETITRLRKVTTNGKISKTILFFKGSNSSKLYVMDITGKTHEYSVGTKLSIPYMLEPNTKNAKERAIVLSTDVL